MLKPHELFAKLPPDVAAGLFTFLHEEEKPLYKATIDTLCNQRKLRPVFIERKPRTERHAWMQDAIGRKNNDSVAAHLLQIYFVGAQSALLCDFLDGLGIAHDENGTIEQMPPAPEKPAIAAVVTTLMEKHPPGLVKSYLHAFQSLDENGWATLGELLAEDERLRL